MVMLPIQPTPFFASKNRAFWTLQLSGWGGYFLLRTVVAVANDQPLDLVVLLLLTTITGFSITLVLSVIYRQLIGRQPIVTWGTTAAVVLAAVMIHASIDAWVQSLYIGGASETSFAQRLIGSSFIPLTLLGGWSALYYAISYFLTVEEQADRLERLEAQATSAQLAMLRYQLNPHFLFNTLNSISTLVLLKQTEPANAMLTRLSSFLRHTLVSEPGSQVTLAQEVETLQLYLDIERMRFEERLRTKFAIEDDAMDARLPSMLLQPLVENAVKYAVSTQEEGAQITLAARIMAGRLRITVEDTGPGANAPVRHELLDYEQDKANQPVSTGVGLANIRNRLMQAYGPDHKFETRSDPGGGFAVTIEIPFQMEDEFALGPDAQAASATGSDPADANSAAPGTNPQPASVITLNPRRAIGPAA